MNIVRFRLQRSGQCKKQIFGRQIFLLPEPLHYLTNVTLCGCQRKLSGINARKKGAEFRIGCSLRNLLHQFRMLFQVIVADVRIIRSATGLPAPERHRPVQQKNRLALAHSMMLKEVHNLAFCPASIVSVGLRKKGAVATVSGFQQSNIRISHDLCTGLRQ